MSCLDHENWPFISWDSKTEIKRSGLVGAFASDPAHLQTIKCMPNLISQRSDDPEIEVKGPSLKLIQSEAEGVVHPEMEVGCMAGSDRKIGW